jgi:serine/threonine-protein kinase
VAALIDGKYEVLGKIAEGGMGAVYKVRHIHLDEVRVLKVLKPPIQADKGARDRFREEARIASALRHPGLALVYDFAADPRGTFFIIMEYVEGVSLRGLLERLGPLPPALVAEIGRQALAALAALHRAGIVHRDVSPENLMVSRGADGRPIVRIIDLGVAKRLQDSPLETASGAFFGKLQYASPEQLGLLAAGEKLDGRADLYAFGGVLHLLATGRSAFEGTSPEALVAAHVFRGPVGFESSDPGGRVLPALRAVISRSLARDRSERFASAEEMAAALAETAGGGPATDLVLPEGLAAPPPAPVDGSELPSVPTLEGETRQIETGRSGPSPRATRRRLMAWAWAAVVVAIVSFLVLRRLAEGTRFAGEVRPSPVPAATPAPTPTGVVLLTATPWAEILGIRRDDGTRIAVSGTTPLRLTLPAGSYTALLSREGATFEARLTSIAGRTVSAHADAPGFDPARAARTYAR